MKRIPLGAGLLGALIFATPLLMLVPTQSAPQRPVLFPWISVAPVMIEARTPTDALPRANTASLRARLAQEAQSVLERSLIKRGVTAQTQRRDRAQPDMPHLTTTVSLPLSLPPGVSGLRANDHKGVFATARIELQDVRGRTLAEATAQPEWEDGDWLTGAPKVRRHRSLDDVLSGFARKGVEQAVFQMVKRIKHRDAGSAKDNFNDSLR